MESLTLLKWLKYRLVISCILFITVSANSQTALSRLSDFGYFQQKGYALSVDGGLYYISGNLLRKGQSVIEREAFVAVYDENLDYIKHRYYDDTDTFQTISNQCRSLIYHNGGMYKFHSEPDFLPGAVYDESRLLRYDIDNNSFTVAHTSNDPFLVGRTTLTTDIILNSVSQLVSTTTTSRDGMNLGSLSQIIDLDSELVQHEFYFDTSYHIIPKMTLELDDSYVVLGQYLIEDFINSGVFALRLSKTLELIEYKEVSSPFIKDFEYTNGIVTSDQEIIMTTIDWRGTFPSLEQKLNVICLDRNLEIKWEKDIAEREWTFDSHFYRGMVQSSVDSSIYLCGQGKDNTAMLTKLNANGDQLWHKTIAPPDSSYIWTSDFKSILESEPGVFTILGDIGTINHPDSIFTMIWLLKVNEEGEVLHSTFIDELPEIIPISLYPNPSAEFIRAVIPENFEGIATLHDSNGKLLQEQMITTLDKEVFWDISNYSVGSYFVRLRHMKYSTNKLWQSKFIKI